MTIPDIITDITAVATVVGAGYTVLAFHRTDVAKRKITPVLWPAIAALISLCCVFENYRLANDTLRSPFIITWGVTPPLIYQVGVNSAQVVQYRDTHKLMLIIRTAFSDVDRFTDPTIEKSRPYTIDGGVMALVHPSDGKLKGLINEATPIEYQVVLLPNQFEPDQIKTLGDIEKLGGKIVSSAQQTAQFNYPPSAGKQ